MSPAPQPAIPAPTELNALSEDAFVAALGPLFEGAGELLRRLAGARPFASDDELMDTAHGLAASMPDDARIALVNAHPRIGAAPEDLSALSSAEQGMPADDDLEADQGGEAAWVAEELANLNDLYEARFGFRYVVFVAGRPREAIIPLMEQALRNERDAELRRGVQDAIYVAGDRLRTLRGAAEETEEENSAP